MLTRVDGLATGGATTENFVYDTLNRLTSASRTGSATISVSYNANGNIAEKSDVGAYVHPNNEGGLLFEREFVGSATINKHYIIGGGGVVALFTTIGSAITGTIEYWHKDALGSIAVRTDASGGVITGSRRAFDAWGGDAGSTTDGYRGFTEHEQFSTRSASFT